MNRVESLRASAGLTKTKLAMHLGLTLKQYQRVLQGDRELRADELWRASKVFQRTVDWFFEQEGEEAQVRGPAANRAQAGG